METCWKCKGGKMTITVHQQGEPDKSFEVDCIYCGGVGQVSETVAAGIRRQDALWCKCGNLSKKNDVPSSSSQR